MKKRLVFRTMTGFLAIWLIFAVILSGIAVRQSQDRIRQRLRHTAQLLMERYGEDGPVNSSPERMLSVICRNSPYLEVGQLLNRANGVRYRAAYLGFVSMDFDGQPESVSFSLLDWLRKFPEEEHAVTGLVKACQKKYGQVTDEDVARQYPCAFVSGWVYQGILYPSRLAVAAMEKMPERDSYDLSGMKILYDLRFDRDDVYDIPQEAISSGREIENRMADLGIPVTKSQCHTLEDWEEMIQIVTDPKLHEQAQKQLKNGWGSDDAIVILQDGLPYGRYYLEVGTNGWEYGFAARADPIREALPVMAGIWAESLLLVLAAGGLVCRAMCRVYDRQTAIEQNRRDTTNALAHDLKTPLALIHGYTENMELGIKPEKTAHYLAQIRQETERMDGLVGGMLDLSRLETGALSLHRETVDLRALMEESAARWHAAMEAQRVTLTIKGRGMISADRELFGGMLDNLLSNALRYTPEGGRICVTADESGLSVENTGEAIPEDVLPRLFEAYYTSGRSRGGRQHGLGLAIVRAAAELHGMSVSAKNTGTGVRLTITF